MAFEVGQTASMKGSGWDRDVRMLALLESIGIETVTVSHDRMAAVTLEVREVKELPNTAENANSRQMDTTGVTGSYRINTEGVIRGYRKSGSRSAQG